jgi:hypothetical protein
LNIKIERQQLSSLIRFGCDISERLSILHISWHYVGFDGDGHTIAGDNGALYDTSMLCVGPRNFRVALSLSRIILAIDSNVCEASTAPLFMIRGLEYMGQNTLQCECGELHRSVVNRMLVAVGMGHTWVIIGLCVIGLEIHPSLCIQYESVVMYATCVRNTFRKRCTVDYSGL